MNFKSSHTSYQVLFCVLNEALICSLLVRRLPLAWAHPLPAQLLQRKSLRCLPELCLPESHSFLLSTPTHMFRLLSGHYRYIQKTTSSFHSFGGLFTNGQECSAAGKQMARSKHPTSPAWGIWKEWWPLKLLVSAICLGHRPKYMNPEAASLGQWVSKNTRCPIIFHNPYHTSYHPSTAGEEDWYSGRFCSQATARKAVNTGNTGFNKEMSHPAARLT